MSSDFDYWISGDTFAYSRPNFYLKVGIFRAKEVKVGILTVLLLKIKLSKSQWLLPCASL